MAAAIALASAVLWLFAAYLLLLGFTALIRPGVALRFLFGFAQTTAANTAEGVARLAIGIAFLILDRANGWSPWGLAIGGFLGLSAVALLLVPDYHRRLAPRLVALVQNAMPFVGLGSLCLSFLLAFALVRAG
ncbi:hypothetical protein GGQ97_000647 [Sphingomonas kaistensis]|uniref:Uncharacterized protein n=1 Tax=Sphingomonas kaistensis TaxID=298708 RepID=A0A7X6BF03_9SPHN|nr:hypothetical protein [Sphingomonas kaistensis]NJC04854.1 hypothetical protein [Sphingomonas kaistensis]